MKATPLISSTLASAVVLRLIKLAVMAMASLPLNSFLLNPGEKINISERTHSQTQQQFYKASLVL